MGRIPAIDGLRAIAVLSVVAYHAGAPAGFVGVDVFFVISGYLITRLLMEDGRLVEFYARRARRILPAAFLCVAVTLGLSFLLLPSAGDVARSAAAAGLFVANLFFQSATGDYWSADAASMPLLHLWSLSVEEQFYLAWPVVLIAARKRPNVLWFVFAASFALYAWLSYADPNAAFYQTPARAWELAAGGLVAMRSGSPRPRFESIADHGPAGVNSGFDEAENPVASARTVDRDRGASNGGLDDRPTAFDLGPLFPHAKLVTLSLGTTDNEPLAAPQPRFTHAAEEDGKRPVVHSEPRARLHVPAILRNAVAFVLRHASRIGVPLILLACLVPLPVPVAVVLSVVGTAMVIAHIDAGGHIGILESRPMLYVGLISYSLYLWHWPLLAIDRATRVGETPMGTRAALVAAAFVLAALSYRYVEQPFRRMRVRPARAVAIGVVCAAALATTAFSLAREPKPVIASSALSCSAPLKPARCVGKEPKVVLWGDSYAGAWEGVVQRMGKVAVGMVDTGCPPVIGIDVPRPTPRASRYCKERAARDLAWLQANGADTLLVTAHWARLLRERPDAGPGILAWAKGLPNVRRIIVIGATPEIRDSIGKCHGEECDIPRGEYEASAAATKAVMRELGKLPNVEVWEVGDWMCGSTCPAFRDGVALYQHDNHHISPQAAEAFVSYQRTAGSAQ